MKAIRVHELGGPEALSYQDIPAPQPSQDEAIVQIEAIGLNFIDIYYREGLYPGTLPFTPGLEAAGTVSAVGSQVTAVQVGDRVAYASAMGAYAQQASVPAWKLVPVPRDVDFQTAAAVMLQGMTAHYLSVKGRVPG